MTHAEYLARLVETSVAFELFDWPTSGIVLWRHKYLDTEVLLGRVPGVASSTVIGDERWIRSVAANPMIDVNKVFDAIRAASMSDNSAVS